MGMQRNPISSQPRLWNGWAPKALCCGEADGKRKAKAPWQKRLSPSLPLCPGWLLGDREAPAVTREPCLPRQGQGWHQEKHPPLPRRETGYLFYFLCSPKLEKQKTRLRWLVQIRRLKATRENPTQKAALRGGGQGGEHVKFTGGKEQLWVTPASSQNPRQGRGQELTNPALQPEPERCL